MTEHIIIAVLAVCAAGFGWGWWRANHWIATHLSSLDNMQKSTIAAQDEATRYMNKAIAVIADRDRLAAELTRLTDRDPKTGRFVRKEPRNG